MLLGADAGELAEIARAAVGPREHRADAVAAVRGWTPEQRRAAALRLHADAVASGSPSYYQRDPIALLAEHGLPRSRADLEWSLHLLADEWGLDDGRVYRLPATLAAGLPAAELDGLAPALQAVLDNVIGSNIPTAIRRDLMRLLGAAIEAATGCPIPPHLLHGGDAFGLAVRHSLTHPQAGKVLWHAAAMTKPVPSAAWRATARALPTDPAWTVLDLFATRDACLHADTDLLLRGLLWMLADDPAATALIGRVATAAATIHRPCGAPRARMTAAAAVDLLAGR